MGSNMRHLQKHDQGAPSLANVRHEARCKGREAAYVDVASMEGKRAVISS